MEDKEDDDDGGRRRHLHLSASQGRLCVTRHSGRHGQMTSLLSHSSRASINHVNVLRLEMILATRQRGLAAETRACATCAPGCTRRDALAGAVSCLPSCGLAANRFAREGLQPLCSVSARVCVCQVLACVCVTECLCLCVRARAQQHSQSNSRLSRTCTAPSFLCLSHTHHRPGLIAV